MYIPMGFIYLSILYVVFNSIFIALAAGATLAFVIYALFMVFTLQSKNSLKYTLNTLSILTVVVPAIYVLVDFYTTR